MRSSLKLAYINSKPIKSLSNYDLKERYSTS